MINTGELTLLSSNGVFSAGLGRIQSFFLLICQSGLIFQQPITGMQPAQLQASLWEASDTELTAVVGRQSPDVVQSCRNVLMTSGDQLDVYEWDLEDMFQPEPIYFHSRAISSRTNQSQNHKCWVLNNICPCLAALMGHQEREYTA